MLIINCLNKAQVYKDILLIPILEETIWLKDYFIIFSSSHIYKEWNMVGDCLSKEGLDMDVGLLGIMDF